MTIVYPEELMAKRIKELEATLREIRELATWYSTKAKGEIYARATAALEGKAEQ